MRDRAARPSASSRFARQALFSRLAAVLVLAWLPTSCRGETPASTTSAAGIGPFGLAHIDLMDLHVERTGNGGVRQREILGAADLEDRFQRALSAGASVDRWSLYWDMVERPEGYDWTAADGIVARDVAAGLDPLVILQGTPGVYATGGLAGAYYPRVGGGTVDRVDLRKKAAPAPQASPPSGLDQPAFLTGGGDGTDDPERAASVNPANPWARFVAGAVQRLEPGGTLARQRGWSGGQGVRAWEIGNEPNLAHFWSGSPSQFARYLEVAYLVIKREDPAAVVVHGGIADDAGAPAWVRSFLAALKEMGARSDLPRRYGYYFDASAWHWYAYPDLFRTGPARARGLLSTVGLADKPLWVTEYGVPLWSEYPGPCWDPRSPWRATTVEQAGYFWQAVAEGLASKVELFVAFQLYDDCGNGPDSYDAFGAVRNQATNQCWVPAGRPCWTYDPATAGTPRPAHAALAAAAMRLSGAQLLSRPAREEGGWQRVLFYVPPDRRVTLAWNTGRGDVRAQLNATGPQAEVLTLADGGVVTDTRSPVSGVITLDLIGATSRNDPSGAALMAGLPVLVDERDTIPPFRASVAAPAADDDGRFEVTISGADGGTGIGRVALFMADGSTGESLDWRPILDEAWPGPPVAGELAVPVDLRVDAEAHFFVRLWDRAGNASEPPGRPHATTRIGEPAPPQLVFAHLPLALARHEWVERRTATPVPLPTITASPPPSTTTAAPTGVPSAELTEPPSTPPRPTATPVLTPTSSPTALSTLTPVAGLPCPPVRVMVTGPRNEPVGLGSGTWVLRAFRVAGAAPDVSEAPIGTDQCVSYTPARLEAVAFVPGYVSPPPQDLALSSHLALAVAPSQIVNGGFEAGLAGWMVGGEALPETSREALSGAGAALLGPAASGRAGRSTSWLAQESTVPPSGTFSLRVRYFPKPTCDSAGCRLDDRIDVIVTDLSAPGQPATVITPRLGIRDAEPVWAHRWFNLTPWEGRRVLVTVLLTQTDGDDVSRLWIDDASLGPATPPVRLGR